ncbi:MAG: B12-binding domain-containing radical SAM protein [Deltaproteobacteria bacterium]|nr:B12-binding domain-containing radical SAM protein [Deltaproteobacteria bacterium]
MKILFVIKDVEYIDPMGIMLLSALAKEKGHETAIAVLADGDLEKKVKGFSPDIVAFSAKTGEHKYYIAANDFIKGMKPDVKSVIGGPHATFFPEIIERHPFDALCAGEGDDAWPELLSAIERGASFDNIPNIVTKNNFKKGQPPVMRERRRALDDLPFLDRDLFYSTTRLGRFPMRSFMIGRGCPYKCTYCFNHKYNLLYKGKGVLASRMSVERVIAELKVLKNNYETQFIKFYDDIFVLKDDEWLDEFSERYPKEIGVPFHCLMRANLLTDSIMRKLKKAGLASLSMSIESGNDKVRNEVLKRNMTKETMTDAFDLCHKYNVPTFSNTIFAIPGTSIAEDIESLDLNLRCRVALGEFPLFFPYPGTELANYAIKRGDFDGDFDKLHMSYQSTSPLKCFTEKEKLLQRNLSLLSTVCLWKPWTRDFIVNTLIKLPFPRLYFLMYYLVKAYLVKTRIYPMKFSFVNTLRGIYESFVLENFKHSDEILTKEEGLKALKGK